MSSPESLSLQQSYCTKDYKYPETATSYIPILAGFLRATGRYGVRCRPFFTFSPSRSCFAVGFSLAIRMMNAVAKQLALTSAVARLQIG